MPTYSLHKRSGRAFTCVYQDGKRKQIYLGEHGSPASHREFRRIVSLHLAGQSVTTPSRDSRTHPEHLGDDCVTIAELCARFLGWAETHYRDKDGIPTGQTQNYLDAIDPLLKLYRDYPTTKFDINCLAQVQAEMLARRRVVGDGGETVPWFARNTINTRIGRIRYVFKKGVAFKLVPASVWHELRALDCVREGPDARETDEVEGVEEADMRAVLPHLPPQLAAMVEVHWLCGARPGEMVQMRTEHIDRGGEIWIYSPPKHKNRHRGQDRRIFLCMEAQEILAPFLRLDGKPLFSPVEVDEWRRQENRKNRKTPVPPNQRARDEQQRRNPILLCLLTSTFVIARRV